MSATLHATARVDANELLEILNDGDRIIATNYWDTPLAHRGGMFCSINAGAVRLLLPRILEGFVEEMIGREVIVTRAPWPAIGGREALELMWEDDSPTPFAVHLSPQQLDRHIPPSDAGREIMCLAYVRGFRGKPSLAGRWPARFRMARSLPYLRPWDK